MKTFAGILALAAVGSAQSLTDALRSNNETSSLQAAIAAVPGLGEILSQAKNTTIFAPNNAAFQTFLDANGGNSTLNNTGLVRAILQYHILNATVRASAINDSQTPLFPHTLLDNSTYENVTGGQYVEALANNGSVFLFSGLARNASVVQADITYDNGVIHIIDQVLTIPENVTATAAALNLTSLASALNSTNLSNAVDQAPNVTIFAPSDAAFSAIQASIANATNETITGVLEYHVVPNNVIFSSDLVNGTKISTLNTASNLTITVANGTYFVNGAQIIKPDILVANGVVHLIDQVLNPANTNTTPATNTSSGSGSGSGNGSGENSTPTSTNQFNASANSAAASATHTGAAGHVQAYPLIAALAAGAAFFL